MQVNCIFLCRHEIRAKAPANAISSTQDLMKDAGTRLSPGSFGTSEMTEKRRPLAKPRKERAKRQVKPHLGPDFDENGKLALGNSLWRLRRNPGPKPVYDNPADLWAACCAYFEWVENNPLEEEKAFSGKDGIQKAQLKKMRAMTIAGLCLHLDIAASTWAEWRAKRDDLSEVITRAEAVIRTQKFEGAAADLLNANIIARDLGLADRSELTGKDGGAIETKSEGASSEELALAVMALLSKPDGSGSDDDAA